MVVVFKKKPIRLLYTYLEMVHGHEQQQQPLIIPHGDERERERKRKIEKIDGTSEPIQQKFMAIAVKYTSSA